MWLCSAVPLAVAEALKGQVNFDLAFEQATAIVIQKYVSSCMSFLIIFRQHKLLLVQKAIALYGAIRILNIVHCTMSWCYNIILQVIALF